ncbi:hypothetical protein PVA38_12495 [Streptococcus pneumoniae D39]|nr:hypothetical protein PVA38_12495 [Streptococcus pneumoniae D39]
MLISCLLYTSDAADEARSVNLGGPCILIKKTTHYYVITRCCIYIILNEIITN